jgi:glutaredoxin
MSMTITLATSKTCGPCRVVKNKLESLGLVVEIKDYTIPEDMEFFRTHNIRSVPRLVLDDGEGNVEIIQGIDDIVEAVKKQKNVQDT